MNLTAKLFNIIKRRYSVESNRQIMATTNSSKSNFYKVVSFIEEFPDGTLEDFSQKEGMKKGR